MISKQNRYVARPIYEKERAVVIEFKNYSLLVVDDDEDLRDLMLLKFRKIGFNVMSANCGTSAMELIKNNKIDLVLSDIRMPDGDGLMLLEQLRTTDPKIPPVIFVTGFSDISVADCITKGAIAVFPKPFDYQELLKSIKSSLNI